jgi:hypothetical protein
VHKPTCSPLDGLLTTPCSSSCASNAQAVGGADGVPDDPPSALIRLPGLCFETLQSFLIASGSKTLIELITSDKETFFHVFHTTLNATLILAQVPGCQRSSLSSLDVFKDRTADLNLTLIRPSECIELRQLLPGSAPLPCVVSLELKV